MLFYEYLKKEIFEIVKKLLEEQNLDSDFLKNNSFNIELSQKVNFGDLSSNVALVFSKFFKTSPEKLAEFISIELRDNKYVSKVEVIKPGFINIFFTNSFWQNQLSQFIQLDGSYNYNLKTKSFLMSFKIISMIFCSRFFNSLESLRANLFNIFLATFFKYSPGYKSSDI